MPLVPVLRPGERTKEGEGRDFQSNRRKSARRKRAEERGWDGWSPGESGENKSGGLLRRAVRDGCYEFDCPPAGPSLPLVSPAIFHPVFRFFAVSLSSPSKYLPSYPLSFNPSRAPGGTRSTRWPRETSPNKVEQRAVWEDGWHQFFARCTCGFRGRPRSRVGKTCSTTDHRPARSL